MHSSLYLLTALTLNGVKSEYNIYSPKKLMNKYEKRNERNEGTSDRAIIGGEETVPGRYPYMAGLFTSYPGHPVCGGTLIDPQWVLSAAHCFANIEYVDIGRYDRSNITESFELFEIDFMVKHPEYNDFTVVNDIMLIRLKEASNYTPISLASSTDLFPPGFTTTVVGWGVTNTFDSSSISDILMETDVDIVSNEDCNSAYTGRITDDMICASRPGTDSCQGDSGGPLFEKGENSAMDKQIGIVSWGFGCAAPSYPGVYARIASGLDFIEDTLSCNITDIDDDCCQINCVNGTLQCVSTSCGFSDCTEFPDDGFDYSNCNVQSACFISDGYCDTENDYNTAECNYDGGDCCEDTCVDGYFMCGGQCYSCRDPESEDYNGIRLDTLILNYISIVSGATINLLISIFFPILS